MCEGLVKELEKKSENAIKEIEERSKRMSDELYEGLVKKKLKMEVSKEDVHKIVKKSLKLDKEIEKLKQMAKVEVEPEGSNYEQPKFSPFIWNGDFHVVPEGFVLPDCDVKILFTFWLCGKTEAQIAPYRFIQERLDFKTVAESYRYSEAKYLMNFLVRAAKRKKISIEDVSEDKIDEIFELLSKSIKIPEISKTGTKRKIKDLSWSTHASLLREKHARKH